MYINNIKADSCTNCQQDIENTYIDFEDFQCLLDGSCAFDEFKIWNDVVYNEETNTIDGSLAELIHHWSFGDHPMDTNNDSDSAIMVNSVTVDMPWMNNLEELIGGECTIEPCYQDIGTLQSSVNTGTDGMIYLNDVDMYTNQQPLLTHSLLPHQGYKLTFDAKLTPTDGGVIDEPIVFCDIVDRLVSEGNHSYIDSISIFAYGNNINGANAIKITGDGSDCNNHWIGNMNDMPDLSIYLLEADWVIQVNTDFSTEVFTCSSTQEDSTNCSAGNTGQVPYTLLTSLGGLPYGNYMMYVPPVVQSDPESTPQTFCGLIELLAAEGSAVSFTQIGLLYQGGLDNMPQGTAMNIGEANECGNWVGSLPNMSSTDFSIVLNATTDYVWTIKNTSDFDSDYFYCTESYSDYCFENMDGSFTTPPADWEAYVLENGLDSDLTNPFSTNYFHLNWPEELVSRRSTEENTTIYLNSGHTAGRETIGNLTQSYNSFGIYFFVRTGLGIVNELQTDVRLETDIATTIENLKLEHLPGRILIHRGNLDPTTGMAYHSNFYTDEGGMVMTSFFTETFPFGSPDRSWNEDDLYAPVTLSTLPDQWINYSLIDIDFSKIEDKVLSDVGPIDNFGILIDDYKIHYEGKGGVKLENQKPMLRTKIGKTKKDKPY